MKKWLDFFIMTVNQTQSIHYLGHYYILWIEYLTKGDFDKVHKATWINYPHNEIEVVLKRIYTVIQVIK